MISSTQLGLFVTASVILIFTPGPDILYVITRGIAQGRRAALAAAAGFGLGNFVHTLFAVLGLSAILSSSATAFAVVKFAGAAYLVYLGVKLFRSRSAVGIPDDSREMARGAIFRQSIVANVLNPKVAVFFLAFFPQFVSAGHGAPQLQMVILGTIFVGLVLLCFGMIGFCSGWIGQWLKKNQTAERAIGKVAGSILVLLGVRLALCETAV